MATYQELLAQRVELEKQQAELNKQISDTLRAERSGVISQIKSLMADHGITVSDLSSKPGRPPKDPNAAETVTRKVAPKYRNPETGDTWSGRGLKPKWLSSALETGRSIEEFTI